MSDFVLYISPNADRRLVAQISSAVRIHATEGGRQPDVLEGVVWVGKGSGDKYAERLRRALWDIDWGDVRGALVVHERWIEREEVPEDEMVRGAQGEIVEDQEMVFVRHMPEQPPRQYGRVYDDEGTKRLVPGRRYEAPDGVVRQYVYSEGGREGWEWMEPEPGPDGRRHRWAAHHEIPGPYVER